MGGQRVGRGQWGGSDETVIYDTRQTAARPHVRLPVWRGEMRDSHSLRHIKFSYTSHLMFRVLQYY